MKNLGSYISSGLLLLFFGVIFCSYMINVNKIKDKGLEIVAEKKVDIDDTEAEHMVNSYDKLKEYYWDYKIRKTYHSKGMRITYSLDTLSKTIMMRNK